MNKKGISFVLILCMMLSMLPMAAFAEDTGSTDVVATIGEQTFTSLQAAVTTSSTIETTIILQKDTKEDITVASGQNITLDLNGKTLTNNVNHTITNNGTLTINDSKGTGKIDNVTHGKAALWNNSIATLTGGEFTRSLETGIDSATSGGNSYYAILNHGTMTIEQGVKVTLNGQFSSLLENGWSNGTDNTSAENSVLTINGGTFTGGLNTVKNDDYGELTITGGVFTNTADKSQAPLMNFNIATITGGTFDSNLNCIINTKLDDKMDKGILNIENGIFNCGEGYDAIVKSGGYPDKTIGDINISGGTFNVTKLNSIIELSSKATVVLNNNVTEDIIIDNSKDITLDLNGQTLSNQSGNTITNNGTLTIIDSSTNAAGVVTGSALVLDNNGTATLEDGYYNSELQNAENATLTIKGGNFISLPNSYTIADTTKEFTKEPNAAGYYTLTNKELPKPDVAEIAGGDKYTTLKEAITAAKTDKATIKLMESVTEDITIAENQDITLEFGTYSLTGNISNGGALTINSGTFNGKVENIVDATNANLVINGGSFKPEPNKDYAAKGYKFVEDPENAGYWILTENKEEPVDPTPETVAKIGEEPYPTLQAAVEAAKAEDTITLFKNTTENITIAKGKIITLALGKDYALNGKMTNDGTLTILSGTFHTSGSALVFVNNGTATLKDGTFNGELQNAEGAALNITGGKYAVDPTKVATNIPAGKEFTKGENETYWTLTDKKSDDPIVPEEPIIVPEPEIKVDTEGSDVKEEDIEVVLDAVESIKPAQNDTTITETVKDVEIPQEVKENAAKILADSGITITENDTVSVVVAPYFDIQVKKYDAAVETANVLTLDITPKYVLKVTTAADPTDMNEHNTATVADSENEMKVEKPITLTITLPQGFAANFVKHMKGAEDNHAVYYYPVNKVGNNNDVSFTIKHGFSEFTFLTDERSAAIHFDQKIKVNDTEVTEITYTAEHVGDALPTPVKNDRFQGWKIDGTTYTTLTEELWQLIADKKEVNATAQYSSSSGGSSGGGSSSSSGGPATSKAVVSSPDNDVKVTYTGVASSLINNVEKAVADNKNIQVVGGSNSAIKVSAKKGDTVLSSFDDPLTVTVPVIKSAVSSITSTSKLTLAKVNKAADGKITFTYMGGNYNEAKNNFTAYVDEPGEYVLLFDNNVQKIALQVGKKANTVNGRTVTNDVAPVIVNSRTMIPLRFVSESLGGQVSWTEATRAVTIKMNGLTMNMTIDQKIDGFDAAPVIRDGRTMVPVRYIAEKLGANVIYVPNTQEIVVVK